MGKNKLGIYIHIPFCISKCNYCSFCSYPLKSFSHKIIKEYFEAILFEIQLYSDIIKNSTIETIYFGGGTPSIVEKKYIEKILEKFQLENCIEITLEANPATVSTTALKFYKSIGINRLSIGIQSFNNEILKFLKRPHNKKDCKEAIEKSIKIFKNLSIDLIFAVPGQNKKIVEQDLSIAVNYNLPHISIYGLSIEKGSKFYETGVKEVDENTYSEMYMLISKYLQKAGYTHYEISNYCKSDYYSKHNINYWKGVNYLGFGAGAHSFYNIERWSNLSNVIEYIEKVSQHKFPVAYKESLSKTTLQNEYIFLNLRKKEGLDLEDFFKKFNFDFRDKFKKKIENLLKNNLITIENNKLSLTEKGFLLSDYIFAEFFT